MTLAKGITDQLRKTPPGNPKEIQALEGEYRVKVKLADCDRLGCLLNRVDLENRLGHPLTLDASQIEDKVTYLGERLEVIETEIETGKAILRSTPPRIDGEVTSFFEIVLDPAEGLSLVRYEYDRFQKKRTPVPAALARDTLERLLNDLTQLVHPSSTP